MAFMVVIIIIKIYYHTIGTVLVNATILTIWFIIAKSDNAYAVIGHSLASNYH